MAKHFKRRFARLFLDEMDFEKYADFSLEFPLLFLLENKNYVNPNKKILET